MINKKLPFLLGLILAMGFVRLSSAEEHAQDAAADVKEFTMVGVEYQGTKMWLPGTIIVKMGQKVKINLINNIKSDPNTHGFAIDAFGIKTVVARGTPQTVEFLAYRDGIFTIYCQLHPAHVGGQILVIK